MYQSSARNCIERAFGRLKARWRRIITKLDLEVETAPVMITACFVLHNMCERSTVCHYDEAWDINTDPELANQNWLVEQPAAREEPVETPLGVEIRAALTAWLRANRPLLKSVW